jgi:hypothetical protein
MTNDLKERVQAIKNWCSLNKIFYLKADILLPAAVIEEAKAIYDNNFFVPHRDSHGKGWESCTLHGEEWNVTTYNQDNKDYKWTKLTEYAPAMTNWLKNIFPNNGNYSRCRFMLLQPGGYIRPHTDTHQWREGDPLKDDIMSAINIAITQPEDCYLRRVEDQKEVPFKPREVYWFNNGPFHEAANFSKEPRIHFILHGGVNDERLKLFIRSFEREFPDAIL